MWAAGAAAEPCSCLAEAEAILAAHNGAAVPITPCGCEVTGIDIAASRGKLPPRLAGALEMLMAHHGFVLLRKQGRPQHEAGIVGTYLCAQEQCALSTCFGTGRLHSTHGVHPEAPCRDVFRLSNDPQHGFSGVGPEWHNDGSFCRSTFGHVVYHIIAAPDGEGNTCFAHLGQAYDALPPEVQRRWRRCASVNSNTGVVHPLVHEHPLSKRTSLYLHLGMTGSMLERVGCDDPTSALAQPVGAAAKELRGLAAWRDAEMDATFTMFSQLLDRPDLCYSHRWREGDVIIIDNLAVAHKSSPGAHVPAAQMGLRVLHRTTIMSAHLFDPPEDLGMPILLDTAAPCPFEKGATWCEGYVGFRWGAWNERTVPH
eukprot:NODE_9153_length_1443_cov_8.945289.p1 GENE.NODE_9153_length_1443_cov_8.945289~~NODE_9153_length_1443_cov_8.945289.p1  ORF type:complete len:370 (-),score=97.75 NODE_9153_length_1443_cov_8.945289:255-1364(-)